MSGGKDPAVLFYTSDFLSGASDLTMEERGQYITLLCLQHQKGRLSRKVIELTVGRVSADVLSRFVRDGSGYYYNPRMEAEMEKRRRYSQSRRENGAKGGRPKRSEEAYAKAYENHTENENSNSIKDSLNISGVEFSFSETTTTDEAYNPFVSLRHRVQMRLDMRRYFKEQGHAPLFQDFWAYNDSPERRWRGIGGERLLENHVWRRYADKWMRGEMARCAENTKGQKR